MILTDPVEHEVSITEWTCIIVLMHQYTIIDTENFEAKNHQEGHLVSRIFNGHHIMYLIIAHVHTGRISMMDNLLMKKVLEW